MDMPPVHMCVFLSHEHKQLKEKIAELKNRISFLEQTIAEKNLDYTHTCSISCQTDITIQHRPHLAEPKKSTILHEEARLHRLIETQNELLRKHENEVVRRRQEHQCPSTSTSALIQDYERRLIRCQQEKQQAERRAASAQKHMSKLERRYKDMRKTMSVFDDGFFEEVDDLKFALQQATNLHQAYEKTIQMLSAQLGITYIISEV